MSNRLYYVLEDQSPPLSIIAEALLRHMLAERGCGLGIVQFTDPETGHFHKITMHADAPIIPADIEVTFKLLKEGETFDE